MEYKYEKLKALLETKGLVPQAVELEFRGQQEGFAFLHAVLSNISESHKIKDEFEATIAAIDQTKRSPVEKYYLLLLECQKHYYKLDDLVHRNVTQPTTLRAGDMDYTSMKYDLSTILNFGKVDFGENEVDSPVTKDEIAFVHLYLISKPVFGEEVVKPMLRQIIAEEKDYKEAKDEIAALALDSYAKPNLDKKTKQQLIQIIITASRRASSLEEYDQLHAYLQTSSLCVSLEDRTLYLARGRLYHSYNTYRDSLRPFIDRRLSPREHQSDEMNQVLDQLVYEANQLFLDEKESQSVKLQCSELLNQLADFKNDIGKIRSVQHFHGSLRFDDMTDEDYRQANIKPNHDVNTLTTSVNRQAKTIEQSINTLSKNTSSLRWGRILLLAIVTLGVGLFGVNYSLKTGGTFFKKELPVVQRARDLIEQGKVDIKIEKPSEAHATDSPQIKLEF